LAVDAAAQADKLALDREKFQAEMEKAGIQIGLQASQAKAKLESQQQLEQLKLQMKAMETSEKYKAEGIKIGVDVAKTKAAMEKGEAE